MSRRLAAALIVIPLGMGPAAWLVCPPAHAGAEGWVRIFGGEAHGADGGEAIVASPAGGFFVAGFTGGAGGVTTDMLVVAYDDAGGERWSAVFDGAGSGADNAVAVSLAPGGGVFVGGSVTGAGTHRDYALLRYDDGGRLLWSTFHDGPGSGYDAVFDMAVGPAGEVYLTGESEAPLDPCRCSELATVKVGPDGRTLWVRGYRGPVGGLNAALAVAGAPAGGIYLAGVSTGADTRADCLTLRYSADGDLLWEARHDGAVGGSAIGTALVVAQAGVHVAGSARRATGGSDFLTLKYSSGGALLWGRTFDGPGGGEDVAGRIAVNRDGDVYVGGLTVGEDASFDYLLLKYDAEGHLVWSRAWNGSGKGYDALIDLVLDADGGVLLTGSTTDRRRRSRVATLRYDAGGGRAWSAEFDLDAGSIDIPAAMTLDVAGNLLVTGRSARGGGGGLDLFVVQYPAAAFEARAFLRGDIDGDGRRELRDGFLLIAALRGELRLPCLDAADVDDSGTIDPADGLLLLRSLFEGGVSPAEPAAGCAPDPTPDALACESPPFCP